jgi:dicarboxylate transporter 10
MKVTYGTTRFALYEVFKQQMQTRSGEKVGLTVLIPIAAASGFVGGIVGNPADVANVRMQGDRGLPVAAQRGYKNVFDAWKRIVQTEGWHALARGWRPNAVRAGLMTSSQLASYDWFKATWMRVVGAGDTGYTHVASSTFAGLVATTVCSPADVIKTRVMSASAGARDSIPQLLRDITREEGLRWMFRGWTPSFLRLGPQTIATFVILEQHRKIYRALCQPL